MKEKQLYTEGKKAKSNFEKAMHHLFKVPKKEIVLRKEKKKGKN